jgi:hypothetical protein
MEVIDQIIGDLQAVLVKAVLGIEPLPGYERPLVLPDLSFATRGDAVMLLDENVLGEVADELRGMTRIISMADLQTEGEQAVVLRFDEPEAKDAAISLRLWTMLARRDGQVAKMSGVRVVFVQEDEAWVVKDEPLIFAS